MRNREILARQWKLLRALSAHRAGLTSVRLAGLVSTSRATIDRDLDTLRRRVGIGIDRKRVSGEVWHVLSGAPLSLVATSLEHAALRLSRAALAALAGTELVGELDALLDHDPAGRRERGALHDRLDSTASR